MFPKEIEVVLSRQLAENLATPIFIVNPDGDLIFYNEPAGQILGTSYKETGMMPASEWATKFHPVDQNGESLPPEDLPLVVAIQHRRPAHKIFWIIDMEGGLREIEVTALPLIAQEGSIVGGVAIFWERSQS